MWALLMGIAHDRDSFFSLQCYQDANEWEYGEVLKRLRMLATLIYAERAQGRYIKQVQPLPACIWSTPNHTRINYHAREAINENKQRRAEEHRIQVERLDWILS